MSKSRVEWTDLTWPIVEGCTPESAGCANCYARLDVHRHAGNPNPKISAPVQGLITELPSGRLSWTGKVILREDRLGRFLGARKSCMVFVPSLGDLFHESVPDLFIDAVFYAMASTPHIVYQVLSKRSERMAKYLLTHGIEQWVAAAKKFRLSGT